MTPTPEEIKAALDVVIKAQYCDVEGCIRCYDALRYHIDTIRSALEQQAPVEPANVSGAVDVQELSKLAETIALSVCKDNGVDPKGYDEWYAPNSTLENPGTALKKLYEMGYVITRAAGEA